MRQVCFWESLCGRWQLQLRWWPFERSFRRRLGTVRRSPSLHLGCRNRARRRSFTSKLWGTQVRSRAMSVARARRRGSTTSVLGRHHGRVRRMVPASLHWERKRGEQFGWLIVRQIQAEWLIQVDCSSSWLAFEWHRWQGARLTDAIIIVSCFSDLIQSDLWREF